MHRRAVRFGARTTGVRWRALRRQRVPFGQYRARYLARWIWFVKFRLRQGSICVWCWCVWTMTSMSGDVGDARDPTCSDTEPYVVSSHYRGGVAHLRCIFQVDNHSSIQRTNQPKNVEKRRRRTSRKGSPETSPDSFRINTAAAAGAGGRARNIFQEPVACWCGKRRFCCSVIVARAVWHLQQNRHLGQVSDKARKISLGASSRIVYEPNCNLQDALSSQTVRCW